MVRTRGGKVHAGEADPGSTPASSSATQEETSFGKTIRTRGGKTQASEAEPEPTPSTSSATHEEIRSKRQKLETPRVVYSSTKIYTQEELMKILAVEDEEEVDATEEGIMIYEDEDLLESLEFQIEENVESEEDEGETIVSSPQVTFQPIVPKEWFREKPLVDPLPFSLNPGVTVDLKNLTTPRDFLDLILCEEMLLHVIFQTNLYAQYLKTLPSTPRSLINQWKPIDMDEIKIFLGILFHMGTISINRISDYWNTDAILFDLSCFRRAMSRDRFLGIMQCLHFAKNPDPSEPIPADRLYKIRPMIEIFHKTMDGLVIPSKKLCIYESMVLWRGRLVFRQYLKNKTHPYGIKLYMLNESSGLVLRFIVYTGASDREVGGKGHADRVVCKLMDGKLDVGHSLYMDNYYNSVNLVHELLERKTYVTGTLRSNRKGIPEEIKSAKPKKGEVVDYYSREGVCILKWHDKRDVLMISSEFSGTKIDCTNRRGIVIQKPETVVKYNESMGGVDHFDQMMAYYPIERKTLKWSKKMGIHILHLCMYNAFTLYNKYKPKMALYDFRNSAIKSLLPPILVSPITSRPPKRTTKGLSPHFPRLFGAPEGSNIKIRKRCKLCLQNKKRTDTLYFCPACPDSPPLCIAGCFELFHKDMLL